jgi:hypothetical protein
MQHYRLARWGTNDECPMLLIALFVGFAFGYGVRAGISRHRHLAARRRRAF